MRQPRSFVLGLALVGCLLLSSPAGAESLTASLVVRAEFGVRTALTVSSSMLQFISDRDGSGATARVDVTASARTRRGADVMLLVEPQWASDMTAGNSVRFEGSGEGMLRGVLVPGERAVAAHWSGSGVHAGTVTFRLLEPAVAPSGPLPIQFLLAAP